MNANENKYKVLALDIDGTLTNSKKEITPAVLNAVRRLQNADIPVLLVSGRPEMGIEHVAKELGFYEYGGYVFAYNGGKIVNKKTGEVVLNQTLPKDMVQPVIDYIKDKDVAILTYNGNDIITEKPDDIYVQKEVMITHMNVRKVDNFSAAIDFPVNKFLITGEPSYLETLVEEMAEAFAPRLNIFRSEPFFIEVVSQGIDKALSLSKLMEMFGLSKENLVACGDGHNDVTMIDYAGMGVAMENACDEVKRVSNFITKSNDEDGVAFAIDKFFPY